MQSTSNRDILIGKIKYSNVWPVFHYFETANLSQGSRLVTEVPSKLNGRMLEGSLDISPMSSFAYGRGSDHLILLPNLSVSSDGPVNSILLFSRKPLHQVVNGRIALTNTSATSVNLLKIIMDKAYGGKPSYWDSDPNLEAMMEDSDAALLIGDQAIQASWHHPGYIMTDLGEIWKAWTGYGMTFAVWAVQQSFVWGHEKFLEEITLAFEDSKQRSLADVAPLVLKACEELGGTGEYWQHYFHNLHYDFGPERRKGLSLYFDYAYEMGLLDHRVNMEIWSHNSLTRVKE
ncbi:menaquinone biosynthetic enzyme MqnA/MqnD family protein [Paenibacillus sanguinis]|uniref:menaquinone biosynthetic enzyme MqnA/MqnD family protein n=1 Tax=Paenibacillus sanguinis TaxID=225906 RepID=UPI00037D99C1|nr:menaquinone biosynthesis protein [Paenibacillus sanguinis]